MSKKSPEYRILQYSNNVYVVQRVILFGLAWSTFDDTFTTKDEAKAAIETHKIMSSKPKIVGVDYVD